MAAAVTVDAVDAVVAVLAEVLVVPLLPRGDNRDEVLVEEVEVVAVVCLGEGLSVVDVTKGGNAVGERSVVVVCRCAGACSCRGARADGGTGVRSDGDAC